MDMDMREMGKRIRYARNMRGLTLQQVADSLGFAIESVAHIEGGSNKPSLQTFIKLGDILDVSLDYLAGRTPSPLQRIESSIIDRTGLSDIQQVLLAEMTESLIPFVKRLTE